MALNFKSPCPDEATMKAAKLRSIIALGTDLAKVFVRLHSFFGAGFVGFRLSGLGIVGLRI